MQSECLRPSKFDHMVFQVSKSNSKLKGEVLLLTNPQTQEKFLCTETITSKLSDLHVIQSYLNRMLNVRPSFQGMLFDYSVDTRRLGSNVFYLIKEYYPYHEYSLMDYIKDETNEELFDTERLSHIFYQIIEIMQSMQDRGVYHGLVSPECIIMISPNKYGLQLASSVRVSSKQTYFEHLLMNQNLYYAPEILNKLKNGLKDDINLHKNDAFCFALAILRIVLKQDFVAVNTSSGISQEKVNINYQYFADRYKDNRLIVTSLRAMLTFNDQQRPDPRKILKALPDYSKVVEYFRHVNKVKKSRTMQTSERLGTPVFAKDTKVTPTEGFISFFEHNSETIISKPDIKLETERTHIKYLKPIIKTENLDTFDSQKTSNKINTGYLRAFREDNSCLLQDLSYLSCFDDKLSRHMREFNSTIGSQAREINLKISEKIDLNKNPDEIATLLKKSFSKVNVENLSKSSNKQKKKENGEISQSTILSGNRARIAKSLNTSAELIERRQAKSPKIAPKHRSSQNGGKLKDGKFILKEKIGITTIMVDTKTGRLKFSKSFTSTSHNK